MDRRSRLKYLHQLLDARSSDLTEQELRLRNKIDVFIVEDCSLGSGLASTPELAFEAAALFFKDEIEAVA